MKEIEINKVPSPTWSWLKIDGKKISVPEELKIPAENPEIINSKKNQKDGEPVILEYSLQNGENKSISQIIQAEEGDELSVIILNESEKDAEGFNANSTKVIAKPFSKVTVYKVHLLGENLTQICQTEVVADENSKVTVNHILLGAKALFMETKCDLNGYKASFNSELSYLAEKEELKDFNYIVNHFGKKTDCNMNVYGTLRDKAEKNYRGTIDFKNGCAGSVGEETEDALLLSPEVKNNSLPVILCREEDVQGEHGATIGRISEEMLYYMESRGFSKKQAENACARAKIQRVLSKIPDENVQKKVSDFLENIFEE